MLCAAHIPSNHPNEESNANQVEIRQNDTFSILFGFANGKGVNRLIDFLPLILRRVSFQFHFRFNHAGNDVKLFQRICTRSVTTTHQSGPMDFSFPTDILIYFEGPAKGISGTFRSSSANLF